MHLLRHCLVTTLASSYATLACASTLPTVAPAAANERLYLEHDYLFVEDDALYATVQSVIDTLLAKQPGNYQRPKLLLYSADSFMASADVDGNLLVATSTLRKLDSEDELAALLAHELAHLIKKHPEKKSLIHQVPVGVDTYAAITAAGDRIEQRKAGAQAEALDNQKRIARSQKFGLFWSDLLAPSWNRKDEQEADRLGLEMLQAAGYDPRALVTLISKLAEANVQRSARMQALCDELIANEQKARLKTDSDDELEQTATQTADELRGKGSEKIIREAFDELLKFSSPYSNNDERVERIKREYASANSRDMVATQKLKYRKTAKDNGELLNLDDRAIAGLSSLEKGDSAAGQASLKPVVASKLRSPHFRLAASAYQAAVKDTTKSEAAVIEWLGSPRAPVIAFMLHGDAQSAKQDYSGALATLEAGRTRIGTAAPFLPSLVTAAKLNKDEPLAERYALECKAAQGDGMLTRTTKFLTGDKPTGLYATCIERLGRMPAGEKPGKKGILDRLKL